MLIVSIRMVCGNGSGSPMSTVTISTDALYERVKDVVPRVEWATMEDDVAAIWRLKRERNAVILAHNYQTPEIFHGVADIVGDSLALAREARSEERRVGKECGARGGRGRATESGR